VDDVFLVASSHSFGAVNREQFYVSISRGRERCHVFTDDAELLQRRIADSNERTAAVELVKLREALAEKGFGRRQRIEAEPRKEAAKEKIRRDIAPRPRFVRPVRSTRLRLPITQRLSAMAREFKNWIDRKTTVEPPRQQVRQTRGMSI
jgi:hypothetical protein